ncbi:MAG: Gp15 family bacteriophage protein [Thomasclavelia sp.]|uniref:Gp15 family bacteriophage protein n=1 Tax=Thomasclavelia sp. TaxID=3025757 RepID=UPI0039A159B5
MIDLTKKDLPTSIKVGGKFILLNTDFRVWIKFWQELSDNGNAKIENLVKDKKIEIEPKYNEELSNAIMQFLYNPNETPNYEANETNGKIIDYYLDGEYIYSAFYRQYGIDLLEADMHWHKFKALCDDLDVGIFLHAKRARGYKKPSKNDTEDKYWQRERKAWSFKTKLTQEEQEKIKEFDDYFK